MIGFQQRAASVTIQFADKAVSPDKPKTLAMLCSMPVIGTNTSVCGRMTLADGVRTSSSKRAAALL